jgi:hypothetical protein
MDELAFKRHLRDLAHGHHHTEEHDWSGTSAPAKVARPKSRAKRSQPKAQPPKKRRSR